MHGCICPQHLGVRGTGEGAEASRVNCPQSRAKLVCQALNLAPFPLFIAFVWIKVWCFYF